MRVLVLHNYHRAPAGEDVSADQDIGLLASFGHAVTVHRRANAELPASVVGQARAATAARWGPASRRALLDAVDAARPEVAYCLNAFPLIPPAVHRLLRARGVPVVQVLRTYRAFCVNALLYRDGAVCTSCVGRAVPWPGALRGCYRGSRAASALAATAAWMERRAALASAQRFVVPSETARAQVLRAGFPPERVVTRPVPVFPDLGPGPGDGGFALFVGRLSAEKGVEALLAAWRGLAFPLVIVGDGPLRGRVERAAAERPATVRYAGALPNGEAVRLMGAARCLVAPSGCLETFGRVVLEAASRGTPAIVPRGSAAAELVRDGHNGVHVDGADPRALRDRVGAFLAAADPLAMRRHARDAYARGHAPAAACARLVDILRSAAA